MFAASDSRDELRCAECGAFFYWPLPTARELKDFYEGQWSDSNTEYKSHYGDPVYEAQNARLCFVHRIELLKERGYSGRLLDVGSAYGTFLQMSAAAGWRAEGLDLSEEACRETAARTGCVVHCAIIETLDMPDETYDFIHASQVIEHVVDPAAFLRAAYRLLKPGGAVLVATPIIPPIIVRATHHLQNLVIPVVSRGREKPYPWAVHYPFHVVIHTPDSLRGLLRKTGFEPVWEKMFPWRAFDQANLKWTIFYHCMNALFRLTRSGMNIDMLAVKPRR
jgi:SAM-dependent methyltransferase